jgi:hypothetical protein
VLRQQLIVLQRKMRGRVQLTNSDHVFFIQLYRWCPAVLRAMMIIRPGTLVHPSRAPMRKRASPSRGKVLKRLRTGLAHRCCNLFAPSSAAVDNRMIYSSMPRN